MKSSVAILLFPWALIATAATVFLLSGDGRYRYPCQDPVNFDKPSCHPPDCIASETCTDMLIDSGDTQ